MSLSGHRIAHVSSSRFAFYRAITEDDIAANLYTADSPPLDILIRTSGVSRLSDFLLWQVRPCSSSLSAL